MKEFIIELLTYSIRPKDSVQVFTLNCDFASIQVALAALFTDMFIFFHAEIFTRD